jgi:hypothetical protein
MKKAILFPAIVILAVLGFSRCASGAPPWGSNPYSLYPEALYLAAEGHGPSRDAAERDALVTLASRFGQSIHSDLRTLNVYTEAALDGVVKTESAAGITEALRISVAMDTLAGAEIRDVWHDGRGLYYALAVMEKGPAVKLYAGLAASSQKIIDELTLLPEDETYSLEGAANYGLAASIADAGQVFGRVLSILGSPAAGLPPGEEYRIRAAEIIRNIPVLVRGEGPGRIKDAFAAALTEAGFRTGGLDSRYVLELDAGFSETFSGGRYRWCGYEISAALTDAKTGTILLPYNIEGREGHLRYEEAEKIALREAEEKIRQSYGTSLGEYLKGLSYRDLMGKR